MPKFPMRLKNVPSSSWDGFCLLLTEPFGLYQHQRRLCHYTYTSLFLEKRTNGGQTCIRKSCLNTPGGGRTGPWGKTGTDSQRGGFAKMESGGSLECHQVSCSHLWLWLYGLDCRCFLVTGADTAGQLNADRRGGWWWEGGASSLWDPLLLDTENQAGRGRVSPTWMKS